MSFRVATSVLALKAKNFLNLHNSITMDKAAATNVPGGGEAVKAGTQPPLQNYLPREEVILDVESAIVSMGELDVKVNVVKEDMIVALKGGDVNTMAGPFPALLPVYLDPFGGRNKLIRSKEYKHAQSIFWEVTQLLLTGDREKRLQIARRGERQLARYHSPSSLPSQGAPTSRPVTLRLIEVTHATKASIIVRMQVVNALLVLHGSLEYIRVLSVATAVLVLPASRGPRPLVLFSVPSESDIASPVLAAEPVVAFDDPQLIQASDVRPRGLSVSSSMGEMGKYDFEDATDDDTTSPLLRRSMSVKDVKASVSSLFAPPSPPRAPAPPSPLAASITPSKSIANVCEAHSPAFVDGQGLPRSQSMTGRAMWFPNAVHGKQPYPYAPHDTPTLPRAVLVRTTNRPPKSPLQALKEIDIENPKKISTTTTNENKENAQPGIETAPAGRKPKTVGSRSWRKEQRMIRNQQRIALLGPSTSASPAVPRSRGSQGWRGVGRARYGQANPPMRLFGAALRHATPYQFYDPSAFFRGTPPPPPPPPMAASSRLRADAPIFRPSGHLRPQLHHPTGTSI